MTLGYHPRYQTTGSQLDTFAEGQQAWAASLRGGPRRARRGRGSSSPAVNIDNLVFAKLWRELAQGESVIK